MELTSWQQLGGGGSELILCLDFTGGRAAGGFAELAAAALVDSSFLHIRQTGFGAEPGAPGRLDTHARRWAHEALETGRPVTAVLGHRAGGALATAVADAIVAAGAAPPAVLLFDAMAVTGAVLCEEFTAAVESSADHLSAAELAGARQWCAELLDTDRDDLPGIAAGLADRYDRLMASVARGLSLSEFFRQELTQGFTAYLDYLLLASQGTLDTRTATPLLLSSRDHELPADNARNISLDVSRAELLRDAEVIKLVADLLRGEQSW